MQKGATLSMIVTLRRAGSDLKLATYSKALRSTVKERGLQAGPMGRSNFYNVIGCSKNNGGGSLRDVYPGSYQSHLCFKFKEGNRSGWSYLQSLAGALCHGQDVTAYDST
jgi:hypothetical protein